MKKIKKINLINEYNFNKKKIDLENKCYDISNILSKISDQFEISLVKTIGINISTINEKIENIELNNNEKISINLYKNKRKGKIFSTNLNIDYIKNIINFSLNTIKYTSKDIYSGIPEKNLLSFNKIELDLFHPKKINIYKESLLASKSEKFAKNTSKLITKTDGGNFSSTFNIYVFGNSHKMLQSYLSSLYFISCGAISKDKNGNMERDQYYTISRSFDDLKSPKYIGKKCAKKVISNINSKKIHSTKSPIIFHSDISYELFKYLSYAINANIVYSKSTFLINSLEKNILPNWINIKEYPHIKQGLYSSPFDEEGVKTFKQYIVKQGILKSWLLDNYSAKKLNLKTNGHKGGIYTWKVSNNNISLKKLIKNMNKGLIVTKIMGQGVNIVTGNYSKGVSGFWVEQGEILYPVSEITISGNLKYIFKNILQISNDIDKRKNIQCGSILISEMQISGK